MLVHTEKHSMSQADFVKAAREGNPEAIAVMLNKHLQSRGITIAASNSDGCLTIVAKSQVVPKQEALVNFLKSGLAKLKPARISQVVIQGQIIGQTSTAWQESLILVSPSPTSSNERIKDSAPSLSLTMQSTTRRSKVLVSTSKSKSSLSKTLTSFGKSRNGERVLLATGTFLITSVFWLGTWSLNSTGNEPRVASSTSSSLSTSSRANEDNGVFTPKQIPVLGNTYQQLEDESTVLQIVLFGKTTDGITQIPKTSLAGVTPNPIAVNEGYPPEGTDVCNLPYSALIRAMYEQCFSDGMSYIQVSNIVGWKGEEITRTGSSTIYQWRDGDGGSMTFTFDNDRLVSQSQTGLKP